MKKFILFLTVLVLAGCATSYQPNGFIGNGGFDDTQLSPNYYRVTFKGNERTSKERAKDFALLRASELMKQKGCPSFKVVKENNEVRTGNLFLPQAQTTNLSTTQFGNYSTGMATTTSYGGGVAKLYFPKVTIEILCVADLPDASNNIYDTDFLNKSLKEKYKIK